MDSLNVFDLDFFYGNRKILDKLNTEFEKGKIYGIMGPNGSGKSTLLKNLALLLTPSKKAIYLSERDLTDYRRKELALKLAFMPQNTAIDFDFTVEDIVMMGRNPYLKRFQKESQKDMEIVENAMATTGVLSFRDRNIKEISGGEMQRVVLARAIAQKTEILLLDEPISQLDVHHQLSIMETIGTLAKERKITVIAVLHDLNIASQYCDVLHLIHQGRIFASGQPQEVITYQNIEQVYQIVCLVHNNPITGRPHVFPVSAKK